MSEGFKKGLEAALMAGAQSAALALVTYLSLPDNIQFTAAGLTLMGKLAVTSFCAGILLYLKQPRRDESSRERAVDKFAAPL